ncbi:hypothetical protein Rhopal_001189-T1 [Rhodotorula paludigena]|uniref:Uncharacterized protein n=1 Tax=Rhodotorula paludigena TaxID=86838 RepID=A0AAV5GCN5_9BASI|nr:hypothetical protein Rhopal_001189-T1 [Rhodotorula paludigena]
MRHSLLLVSAFLSAIGLARAEPPTLNPDLLSDTYCAQYTQGDTPDTALCSTLAQATSVLYYISTTASGNVEAALNALLAFLAGDDGPLDGILGAAGSDATLSTLLDELLGNLHLGRRSLAEAAVAQAKAKLARRQLDGLLGPLLDTLLGPNGLITSLLELVGQLLGMPSIGGDASNLLNILQSGGLQQLLQSGALDGLLRSSQLADLLSNPDIAALVSSGESGQLDVLLSGIVAQGGAGDLVGILSSGLDPTALLNLVKGLLEALVSALGGLGGAGTLPIPLPVPSPSLPTPNLPGLGDLPLSRHGVGLGRRALLDGLLASLAGPQGLIITLLNALVGLLSGAGDGILDIPGIPGLPDLGSLGDVANGGGSLPNILTNGGLDQILANPAVSGLLQKPALAALVQSGQLGGLVQSGSLDGLLGGLLSNGGLSGLTDILDGLDLGGAGGFDAGSLLGVIKGLLTRSADRGGLPLPLPGLPLERRDGKLGETLSSLLSGVVGNAGIGAFGIVDAVPQLLQGVTPQCRCDVSNCYNTMASSLQIARSSDDESAVIKACADGASDVNSVIPECADYFCDAAAGGGCQLAGTEERVKRGVSAPKERVHRRNARRTLDINGQPKRCP